MADTTPTYIAYCPECSGFLAASVADVNGPNMAFAVRDRARWQRAGLRLETKTVQDVRDHKGPPGHVDGLSLIHI